MIPATLVAFHQAFEIDVEASRKHLRDVSAVDGLNAITFNGHSTAINDFTMKEQQILIAKYLKEVG